MASKASKLYQEEYAKEAKGIEWAVVVFGLIAIISALISLSL